MSRSNPLSGAVESGVPPRIYRMMQLLLLGFLAAAPFLAAQTAPQPKKAVEPVQEKLDKLFEDWDRLDRPGGAVVVVQDGRISHRKAFGLASLEWSSANTPKTVFDVAELAQPMVGMALAMLAEEKKLSLDDEIHKHLPELPAYGQPVTLRNLLEHSSGIPSWNIMRMLTGYKEEDPVSMDAALEIIRRPKTLAFAPGAHSRESNSNYVLLAEVLRRVTGESLRDWTWKAIFKPLKMTRTFFRDNPRETVDRRAFSYNFHSRDGYLRGADNLGVVGSNSLFTSAEDLGKWLANFQGGSVGGPFLQKLHAPGPSRFWYGWRTDLVGGTRRLHVRGSWGGFRAAMEIIPEKNYAAAILSNWDYSFHDPQRTLAGMRDIFLPPGPEKPKVAEEAPKDFNVEEGTLDTYKGRYRMNPGFNLEIAAEKGSLLAEAQGRKYPLTALAPDRFRFTVAGAVLRFVKDAAGRVNSLAWMSNYPGEEERILPRLEPFAPSAEQLGEYAGEYLQRDLDARFTVVLHEGKLRLDTQRLGNFPLQAEAKDQFLAMPSPFPLLVFDRDDGGRIRGLHIETEALRAFSFERKP